MGLKVFKRLISFEPSRLKNMGDAHEDDVGSMLDEEYNGDEPRSDGEEFRPPYKFNDEDGKHEHLLWSERKQDWEQLTGVTTIIDVLGKVLTWWASGKAVETLGWTNSKIRVDGKYQTIPLEQRIAHLKPFYDQIMQDSEETYLSRLDTAYKAHSVFLDKSADAGTDMHQLLEDYVNDCVMDGGKPKAYTGEDKRIEDFAVWAIDNIKKFIWSEAYCYDEMLFVGGITDCGAIMNDGKGAIIDFKSSKEAYFNHFVQIALYNLLIEKHGLFFKDGSFAMMPDKEITKYIVIPFGAKEFTVVENTNVKGLKEAGLACVKLYREKNRFENN